MTLIAASQRHRENDGCQYSGGSMHCYIHQVDEVGEGAYVVCGECFHVYRTGEDLVTAQLLMQAEMALIATRSDYVGPRPTPSIPTLNPEKIFSCPKCAHDF